MENNPTMKKNQLMSKLSTISAGKSQSSCQRDFIESYILGACRYMEDSIHPVQNSGGTLIKAWLQKYCPSIPGSEEDEDIQNALSEYKLDNAISGSYNPGDSLKEGGRATRAYSAYLSNPDPHLYNSNWKENLNDDDNRLFEIARGKSETKAVPALDTLVSVYKTTMGNITGQ